MEPLNNQDVTNGILNSVNAKGLERLRLHCKGVISLKYIILRVIRCLIEILLCIIL